MALTDAIADARYRQLEREWQRNDPVAYQRLCALRLLYPHLEYTTSRRQMLRLELERHIWRNGDTR